MASRKRKTQRRRKSQKKGGAMLHGAPLAESLSGDWSSKMSMGQGGDYLKYHVGQHGGMAGAPLSAIDGSVLPMSLRGAAHMGGLDKSFTEISGLKDQAGGRRRRRASNRRASKCHSRKSQGGKRRASKRHGRKSQGGKRRRSQKKHGGKRRRTQKKRGGSLGYAPVGSAAMLLDGAGYSKAGLTPQWSSGVEFDAAKMRESM